MSKNNILSHFVPDKTTGVYLSPGEGNSICYSDGSEDKILRILENTIDRSSSSMQLESAIDDWPTKYHFSNLRPNIIRSLEYLNRDSRILEIGAGCGAVTRYLGEYFKAVDCVEGDPKRAYITRQRTRELANVRVYCSALKDIEFEPEYDVVTLIGVLEYSPIYYCQAGKNKFVAALAMLRHAVSALRENGILILAIENRLGLKYWSGCREDHTGSLYDGIHGYVNEATPVTFSKNELIGLLRKAELKSYSFYYPFPDYKLADTVLRDVSHPSSYYLHNWINAPFEDYVGRRGFCFNEVLALKSLVTAEILYEFSNSFLVIASCEQSSLERATRDDWVAKRFSTNRIPPFRTVTVLKPETDSGSLVVRKRKLLKVDEPKELISLRLSDLKWIPGDLLYVSLCEAIFRRDSFASILEIFSIYHKELLRHYYIQRTDEEGYPLLKSDAIDFVPWNIVTNDQGLFGIDKEWVYYQPVSADLVLFRSAFQFVYQQSYFLLRYVETCGRDLDKLLVSIIQSFYPQYTLGRHSRNKRIEEELQFIISGRKVKIRRFEEFDKSIDPLWERELLIKNMQAQIQSFQHSLSWKITSPFRWMLGMIKRG